MLKRFFLIHFVVLIFLLILHRIKVFKVASVVENEKGTSVRVRDYTRSCKFLNAPRFLDGHCPQGGKTSRRNLVRRPAFFYI